MHKLMPGLESCGGNCAYGCGMVDDRSVCSLLIVIFRGCSGNIPLWMDVSALACDSDVYAATSLALLGGMVWQPFRLGCVVGACLLLRPRPLGIGCLHLLFSLSLQS